jgi:hypothetical protein
MNRDHDENESTPISPIVLEKIQTFRTITTLLEILQDPSLNTRSPEPESHPPIRINHRTPFQSLQTDQPSDHRSLCALATLLVRNRDDVTAVAMQDPSTSRPPVEILVCRHELNPRMVVPEQDSTGPVAAFNTSVVDVLEPSQAIIPPEPSTTDSVRTTQPIKDTWYGPDTLTDERFLTLHLSQDDEIV